MTITAFEEKQIRRDEVEFSTSLRQEETELFARISSGLAKGGMSSGQAIILLARYACTIEDRVLSEEVCC